MCIRDSSGDIDPLILFGGRRTDGTVSVSLGDRDLCVVYRLCGSLFTERGNIPALVVDIGHVDVYQAQTDLFELCLNVARNRIKELVAVGVDLLDVHRGDDKTKLTEDYILGKLLYLGKLETEKALGCVLHHADLGRNTDGETRGNVNTDVLVRQRVRQINRDRQRRQIEILILSLIHI